MSSTTRTREETKSAGTLITNSIQTNSKRSSSWSKFSVEFTILYRKYNVLVKKSKYTSGYLKEIISSEEELINSIRLINLNQRDSSKLTEFVTTTHNPSQKNKRGIETSEKKKKPLIQYYDAITLEVQKYEKAQSLFDMMKSVNDKNDIFLRDEFK